MSSMGGSTDSSKQDNWLPQFPSEEPTAQQMHEWLKQAKPLLVSRGYDHDVRGETRPEHMKFDNLHDMDGLTTLTSDEAGGKMAMQKHNSMIKRMLTENAHLRLQKAAALNSSRNLLASAIQLSLQPKAPLRLEALLNKHKDTTTPTIFNGTDMWKELAALSGKESDTQDLIDHDRALELLHDRRLADGCAVSD